VDKIRAAILFVATVSASLACSEAGPLYERGGTATATPPRETVLSGVSTMPACQAPYPAAPVDARTVFCADPAAMERAVVVGVVDGDTIDVALGGVEERVRVFGIDTPERGEPCFGEATERMRALAGDEVRMAADARNRDRNGRLLRYVYTTGGLSIDAVLIAEGYALAWTRDGALRDPLVALEALARGSRTGCLWR
jgi:micrococcal nuclease